LSKANLKDDNGPKFVVSCSMH